MPPLHQGHPLSPQRLSSTVGFSHLFSKRMVGGIRRKGDAGAAGGILSFVFVFSQGSPKHIEFLAYLSSYSCFFGTPVFGAVLYLLPFQGLKRETAKRKLHDLSKSKYLSSRANKRGLWGSSRQFKQNNTFFQRKLKGRQADCRFKAVQKSTAKIYAPT